MKKLLLLICLCFVFLNNLDAVRKTKSMILKSAYTSGKGVDTKFKEFLDTVSDADKETYKKALDKIADIASDSSKTDNMDLGKALDFFLENNPDNAVRKQFMDNLSVIAKGDKGWDAHETELLLRAFARGGVKAHASGAIAVIKADTKFPLKELEPKRAGVYLDHPGLTKGGKAGLDGIDESGVVYEIKSASSASYLKRRASSQFKRTLERTMKADGSLSDVDITNLTKNLDSLSFEFKLVVDNKGSLKNTQEVLDDIRDSFIAKAKKIAPDDEDFTDAVEKFVKSEKFKIDFLN